MPESGRRIYATHVARITKVAAVPLRYAYGWLTDYRTDDGKLSGSGPRFKVTKLSEDRVVRVRYLARKAKPLRVAVELIRLRPPDAWHLDQIDEADLNSVDYKLTRLGAKKTRITLVLVERWMVPNFPAKVDWVRGSSQFWSSLVKALEDDYQHGLPARG